MDWKRRETPSSNSQVQHKGKDLCRPARIVIIRPAKAGHRAMIQLGQGHRAVQENHPPHHPRRIPARGCHASFCCLQAPF